MGLSDSQRKSFDDSTEAAVIRIEGGFDWVFARLGINSFGVLGILVLVLVQVILYKPYSALFHTEKMKYMHTSVQES